ncbi:MAG: hypothetical protein JWM68_3342 [Verrucomicrobiales bacterium]|nr:hypothetical protein [Verrucomicrobiales bacterium]
MKTIIYSLLPRLDAAGATLSTLCAIHCVLMPFVLALLPAFGLSFLADRTLERTLCVSLMALASFCLWNGFRQHRHWRVYLWLAVGLPLIAYAQWNLPDDCCLAKHDGRFESTFMFVGGLVVAAGHLHNRRLMRLCCGSEKCPHGSNDRR